MPASLLVLWMMVCLGLMLSGCGPRLGPPQVSYGPPIEWPLVHPDVDRRRWYVLVDSDRWGERLFFLDTGYAHTTCDDDFATEAGLVQSGIVQIRGEAGVLRAKKARLPAVKLGGTTVEDWSCVVRDLNTTSSILDPSEVDIAGVIGMDLLRRFRVTIDPQTAVVTLRDPASVPPLDPDAPGVLPLRREYRFGLREKLPVQVGDQVWWPIIDTGATASHIDGRRMGLQSYGRPVQAEVRATGSGVGRVRELIVYRIPRIVLADLAFEPVMWTDRRRARWVPGLLGLDVLGELRQDYDFEHRRVRLSSVPEENVGPWRAFNARRSRR